jgi:hypothetical protein
MYINENSLARQYHHHERTGRIPGISADAKFTVRKTKAGIALKIAKE